MYRHFIKRLIDIVFAICGLIVLVVPMFIIAIAIIHESKGSALFRQKRLGKHRKIFTIFKFRTMCEHAFEKGGVASSEEDPRITKVGRFLRKTSLDEFPQLLNIIRGNMAIIGPRPILPMELEEVKNYNDYQRRFDALPGMFCTVDLTLRAKASRKEQFEMDVEYVDKMSILLDAKVFGGVIWTVISRKNVYRN